MFRRTATRSGRGQSVVEFALSLPFLILLLAGVVDFANAYRIYIAMTNAAREGAYEVATTGTTTNVCARVNESLSGTITFTCPDASIVPAPTFPSVSGCTTGAVAVGCPVRVIVNYSAQTYFAGILGLSSIPMSASADMMVLTSS